MNIEPVCPKCGKAFQDEDFCPRHGVRLVAPVADTPSPDATAQADGEGADMEPDSKLARFMGRLGLRRVAEKRTLAGGAAAQVASTEQPSLLPDAVREMGWRTAGPARSSAGVDLWPVERSTDDGVVVSGHFHRYRTGALTTHELYRGLEVSMTPQLARVLTHGTVDMGGARADYELVSLPKAGSGLTEWFKDGTPSEQRAWHLLPLLVDLLRQLAAANVRPLTLEPDWLQYADDGELWLTTASALTDIADMSSFHAEFERSALLSRSWAAPELTQQYMSSANAVVFSLGQVLAEAVWGYPCSIDELQKGVVPFQALADTRLARVLMGCLWTRASDRWTVEQVFQAAACDQAEAMPATPPWASLASGASGTAFALAGTAFWRLEDLLAEAVMPSRWDEASARIGAILDWGESTAWAGKVKLMRKAMDEGRSADWVLVALTRAVLPDTPPTWRALDLSESEAMQSLVGLAQRALHGVKADMATMRDLFEADLRGAFVQVQPKPEKE